MSISIPNKIPVVFLFGPTAVGKTDLLLELFSTQAEIVSADSVQVYRKLNIGSAKPAINYLKNLPHHLIDILDLEETFSTGDFVRLADQACREIVSRGKFPVVSGGTAFYFRNFFYGLPSIDADTAEYRRKLQAELDQKGLEPLWKELQTVDPRYASKIASRDRQRILRALEVYRCTGKPLSSFAPPDKPRENYRFLSIGLQRPREELYSRINKRVERMIEQGLEQEVQQLHRDGARRDFPSMKAIGYREFFPEKGEGLLPAAQIMPKIQQNTRRYAKRQMTFFRSMPEVQWYNPDKIDDLATRIEEFWNNNPL